MSLVHMDIYRLREATGRNEKQQQATNELFTKLCTGFGGQWSATRSNGRAFHNAFQCLSLVHTGMNRLWKATGRNEKQQEAMDALFTMLFDA